MKLDSPLSTSRSEKMVDDRIKRNTSGGRRIPTKKNVFTGDIEGIDVNSLVNINPSQEEFILKKGTSIKLDKIEDGVYHFIVLGEN